MAAFHGFAAYYRRRAAQERARAALARTARDSALHLELAEIFEERALVVEESRGAGTT